MLNPDEPPPGLPATCAVALKEWAGVCDALATGRQILLLRKGGIAEGPGGFEPEHDACWLLPTSTHEAEQGLRVASPRIETPRGEVGLHVLLIIENIHYIENIRVLEQLEPFHVWTAATVRKRFEYRRQGLWVIGVRAYRRAGPHRVRLDDGQAGCRSWVALDEPLSTSGLEPVLADDEAADRRRRWTTALGAAMRRVTTPGVGSKEGRDG
ncbi:MAG TPA: DUF1802 family protein [Isosphaeraceae bacterium]|nr:DUF1802 family protein [Isosphaeraceae bacterium]